MSLKNKGISQAAQLVPCPESTMRRLDRLGVVRPVRDPWGRRLFGDDDIKAARAHIAKRAASHAPATA